MWTNAEFFKGPDKLQHVLNIFNKAVDFGYIFSLHEDSGVPQDIVLVLTSAEMLEYPKNKKRVDTKL